MIEIRLKFFLCKDPFTLTMKRAEVRLWYDILRFIYYLFFNSRILVEVFFLHSLTKYDVP